MSTTIRNYNLEHSIEAERFKSEIKRLHEEKSAAEVEASNLRTILAQ